MLRALVFALGGTKPVADLFSEDRTTIALWTQKGVPEMHASRVADVYRTHSAVDPGWSQRPGYDSETAFSLVI